MRLHVRHGRRRDRLPANPCFLPTKPNMVKQSLYKLSLIILGLTGLAFGEQCQITSPIPVPVSIAGCTYSGTLPGNSTSYIQNTLSPTISTQAFNVSTGTISSGTINNLNVPYGITAGTMTGAGLSVCGDSTHGLSWSGGTFGCQSITGSGGGGGSSSLAVTTGTSSQYTGPPISSPTAVIVFDSNTTNGQLTGGGTYFYSIRPDSVTLQGNGITFASLGSSTGTLRTDVTSLGTSSATDRIDITALGVSTSSIRSQVISVGNSTATLRTDVTALGVSTDSIRTQVINVGNSTATLRTDVTALGVSTDSIRSQVILVGNSTATLRTDVTALGVSTDSIRTQVINVGASTATLRTDVTSLGSSTATLRTDMTNVGASTATLSISTMSLASKYPVSLTTGVVTTSILPAANMVSTVAFTTSTQTFSGSQAFLSSSTFYNTIVVSSNSTGVQLVSVSTTPATLPSHFLLTVSSTDATMALGVQNNSHIISSGTAPGAPTSCGTSPSVDGTDFTGIVTVGGGVVTSCTLPFSYPFNRAPICIVSTNSTAVTADVSSINSSAVTFGFSATLGGGSLWYICIGNKG